MSRVPLLKPTAINAILAEIHQLQAARKTAVSLMRGEPDFDTPPHIVLAAAKAMQAGRTRYPDNRGDPGLRFAVAQKLKRDNGLSYDGNSEILVTTGATLGIYLALTAILAALERKGVLQGSEIQEVLGEAEARVHADRREQLRDANQQAILFPIRYLREATSENGQHRPFHDIAAGIGRDKDDA